MDTSLVSLGLLSNTMVNLDLNTPWIISNGGELSDLEHLPKMLSIFTHCSWSDQTLSQSLITAITNDPDIKQGLFPPPGLNASSAKGGGKKKILWQWKVAIAIFKDHPVYRTAFAMAYNCMDPKLKPKLQTSWAEK